MKVHKQSYERIRLGYRLTKCGINVAINDRTYRIKYPPSVWKYFPIKSKHFLSDNLISLVGMQLPFMLGSKKVFYRSSFPLLEPFFREVNVFSAPSCSDADRKPVSQILRQYINVKHTFKNYNIKKPNLDFLTQERAIVPFTFGKDSLLSYAVCREIGLDPLPVYIREPDLLGMYENQHKKKLQKKFAKEFHKRVLNLDYGLGYIRYYENWKIGPSDFGSTTQLTEYALSLLPFMKKHSASYLVFGNEKSCSDSYYTQDGFESNPVFDQSPYWMLRLNSMLAISTRNKCSSMSVVEPLHELAITRILHKRYAKFGKYQSSCFSDSEDGISCRWCHNCSKCARMYIFLLALGINPKRVEFKKDMLGKECRALYTLFSSRASQDGDDRIKPYDLTGLGKDEQLFAFYLAYKRGAQGYLIDEFKEHFLKTAVSREDELYSTFLKPHTSITMPEKIRKSVMSIYKEELKNI
jgi:hypothetical protein